MDNFKFMVGFQAGKIRIVNLQAVANGMSKDEALELAAWLCVLAGDVDVERVKALINENL